MFFCLVVLSLAASTTAAAVASKAPTSKGVFSISVGVVLALLWQISLKAQQI